MIVEPLLTRFGSFQSPLEVVGNIGVIDERAKLCGMNWPAFTALNSVDKIYLGLADTMRPERCVTLREEGDRPATLHRLRLPRGQIVADSG
jgi:hypothetical protein